MKIQQIAPENGTAYSDAFWATLYRVLCGFGFAEVQLIWMRSSAFLVAHAAFLGLVGRGPLDSKPVLLVGLAVAGLLLTWLWMVVNSVGWIYQNLWYWYAANLKFTKVTAPLPTDFAAADKPPRPGRIFLLAQSVCLVFAVAYSSLLGFAVFTLGTTLVCALVVSAVAILLAVVAGYLFHQACYRSVTEHALGSVSAL